MSGARFTPSQLWDRAAEMGHPLEGPRPVETVRKKRSQEESICQRNLIRWWAVAHKGFSIPEQLFFSVPNGGHRHAITAAIMKAEGCRRGVPDLFLLVPRKGYSSLAIEMKTKVGVLSLDQVLFHAALRKHSCLVEVCRSIDDGVKVVTKYLT